MSSDGADSSLTRVQPFFAQLLRHDPAGGSWLAALLQATPHGRERLGELLDRPGWLEPELAVRAETGRLGCFEFVAGPSQALLGWYIDHPETLVWPEDAAMTPEAERLRSALLRDDPPGSQPRAQERARELLGTRSFFTPAWWRFEDMSKLDCVLITDRLVITVEGQRDDPPGQTTDWYPQRTALVRTLEAAKALAEIDGKQWATVLLSDEAQPEASRQHLARTLPSGAPHLDEAERDELHDAYLGNLTWRQACDVVGIPWTSLPDAAPEPRSR